MSVERSWARSSGGRTDSTLAVVDFHDHRRGGHFGAWLRWFTTEFSTRFDHVSVVTPNPELTAALFDETGTRPPNTSFHRLPRKMAKRFDRDSLYKLKPLKNTDLHVFVMWAFDLLPIRAESRSTVPWAALTGMSWFARDNAGPAAEMERELADLLSNSATCKAFFQPDGYLKPDAAKAVWVPDIEDVRLPPSVGEPALTIRSNKRADLRVGAFGQLWGRRCVNELLRLAQVQRDVQFVLAGRLKEETVDPELRPLLADGALPNLLVVPGFIEGEEDLNAAIESVDAVFIDGANYPVQSGIIGKALHFGKWILTPGGNSWSRDLIDDRGVGLAYGTRETSLVDAWTEWKRSGGESRSRDASETLRDSRKVTEAFDGMTERLLNA